MGYHPGRFDISVSVMVISRFQIAPRQGQMEHLKRIFGYLRKHPDGAIRFRTGIPDNEKFFTPPSHDWMNSVYGNKPLDLDEDMYPVPLENLMRITSFVDSCLGYCKVTGKSITGIIHLINQTPIKYFCKFVETTVYGSEFVAIKQCAEQIRELKETLKLMEYLLKS